VIEGQSRDHKNEDDLVLEGSIIAEGECEFEQSDQLTYEW